MKRLLVAVLSSLFVLSGIQVTISEEKENEDEELELRINGVYYAWFQKQQDFFFGKVDYNDNYVVQMLRLNLNLAVSDNLKAVTRFDLAQGWWGVDNDDFRGEFDDDNGSLSSRFSNKDTNYGLHVDIGYLDFMIPDTPFPINIRVGRMYYGLGNKIVLDSNFDGVQVDFNTKSGKVGVGWGRVSEGVDALTDNETVDAQGNVVSDGDDANIFLARFDRTTRVGNLSYGVFGMYYRDDGDDDGSTFTPHGIDYFRTRFSPSVSKLGCVGLTFNYQNNDLGLNLLGELDYLAGKDDIGNTDSGTNQLQDVNDGDLNGFNLYLKGTKSVSPKIDLGLVFGVGSGDDDPTGGNGNINKLKTMGYFYITELWEDSIMPDEEGITPQGLGAPNTRGYRELENTTILQGSILVKPLPKLKLFGSYSYLRATADIRGWGDTNGDGLIQTSEFTGESSNSIGSEIDFKIDYNVYKQLVWSLRGGYLIAGDAAQLLINGNTQFDNNPWELKLAVVYKF
ncbi:alginate export family protein [candidate division KSB1 bacterium]|nr:alginate export family protein [candidate division KSB1 bacterium]NIR72299.1 alginate export family protein [candidate division KSB1 bacterium]NIS26691.1 alginate export family protein [candidate division KSB1 bacterium]NIT70327.1 alginate export family protein [candidate division KSB1 bacterium]NIU27306.1 alginate export family protein [candidate division KSB1 bacterium]